MVLGLVGETIDVGDEICGARVVDKSKGNHIVYRFELWLRSDDHSTADRSVAVLIPLDVVTVSVELSSPLYETVGGTRKPQVDTTTRIRERQPRWHGVLALMLMVTHV